MENLIPELPLTLTYPLSFPVQALSDYVEAYMHLYILGLYPASTLCGAQHSV